MEASSGKPVLYMFTIHKADGKRVGMEISEDPRHMAERLKVEQVAWGKDYSFKLWSCHEMDLKEAGKDDPG